MKLLSSQDSPSTSRDLRDLTYNEINSIRRYDSPFKNPRKKSIQVTCSKKSLHKTKYQNPSELKIHTLAFQTPKQKRRDSILSLTLKSGSSQIKPFKQLRNLIVQPDLIDYQSLTTMDSFRTRRQRISFLWNNDSPVNRLTQQQQNEQNKSFQKLYI